MVRTIPKWQRSICGILAVLGILCILNQLVQMIINGHLLQMDLWLMVFAGFGCLNFGYVALYGSGSGRKNH